MSFPNPLKLLGLPFSEAIGAIGGLIDGISTTEEEKLAAKAQLASITQDYRLKLAQVDAEVAKEQARVVIAEAQSVSWLARNWRPLLMLTFVVILVYNWIISPLFSQPSVTVPSDMWDLLKIGVGGYVVGRSAEKIAPAIADVITSRRKE
jgi:hypothetical protein